MNPSRWATAALLALPLPVAGQVAVVDEGSFTITREGARAGRESFTIRRNRGPGGDIVIANATVELGEQRLTPALRADSGGAPLAYQVEVKNGADVQERLSGQVGRGRFSARVRTATGESAREYLVGEGALVLDDDVFHQYYFVARRERIGAVPVVIPRRNLQVVMRLQVVGEERITVGGTSIEARHVALIGPDGDRRDVWADERGRVLKVELSRNKMVAVRDEPPR